MFRKAKAGCQIVVGFEMHLKNLSSTQLLNTLNTCDTFYFVLEAFLTVGRLYFEGDTSFTLIRVKKKVSSIKQDTAAQDCNKFSLERERERGRGRLVCPKHCAATSSTGGRVSIRDKE